MKRPFLPLLLLGLATASSASPSFGYTFSDTRTLLTNDPDHFGDFPSALWGGTLKTKKNDAPLYLNSIVTTDGAGWDSNIASSFEVSPMDYVDLSGGTAVPGQYAFGTAIPAGANWQFREIASFDNAWNSGTPALGTYDFNVKLIGGNSASATDVLASFDLHLEVAERLDADVTGTSTPILGANSVGHVNVTVRNDMVRNLVVTSAFKEDDAFGPGLTGTFVGNWGNVVLAPGDSITKAHSNWRSNGMASDGTFTGGLGVVGGLHYGDSYFLYANPRPQMVVQGVPEPTTMVALALGLGAFARRRRKA